MVECVPRMGKLKESQLWIPMRSVTSFVHVLRLTNNSGTVEKPFHLILVYISQVINACECQWSNPINFRRLEAYRLKASADIRDCEQRLNSAHEIIELLQRKTSEQLVKLGLGLAFLGAVTMGENIS